MGQNPGQSDAHDVNHCSLVYISLYILYIYIFSRFAHLVSTFKTEHFVGRKNVMPKRL